MITDVLIRNFKCFNHLTIPDLGRITLIAGKNNVGKTALLEALFLLLDRQRPDMILRQYGWRGIEGVSSNPKAMWAPVFYNHDLQNEIIISSNIEGKSEEAHFRFIPNYVVPTPPFPTSVPKDTTIPTKEEWPTSFALEIDYLSKSIKTGKSHLIIDSNGRPGLFVDFYQGPVFPIAHFLASKSHTPSRETTNLFSELAKEGKENKIVEFLRIIEPRLESLKVITEGPNSFVHGQLDGSPLTREIHMMGEGMEKLLNIILFIANSFNGTVFLDEIENGLHYSVLIKVWEAIGKSLKENNCQLIVTTHSNECIEAAYEGLSQMPEEFRYIRLDRKGSDITAKLSNYDMVGMAIKTNVEMR